MDRGTLGLPRYARELFSQSYALRLQQQYLAFVMTTPLGQQRLKKIETDPRISKWENHYLSNGYGGSGFDAKQLAAWYAWCENEYDQVTADKHLNIFLDSEEREVIETLWVLGIAVSEPIDLVDGYQIVPPHYMPESEDKENFTTFTMGVPAWSSPAPQAAIIKLWKIKARYPLESDEHVRIPGGGQPIQQIAWLLNLLPDVTCQPFLHRTYVDPLTPPWIFSGSGGAMWNLPSIQWRSTRLTASAVQDIGQLFKKCQALSGNDKERMIRVLTRLAAAKSDRNIEDAVLDLGIVLEMLLLHGESDKQQLALSFRLRGAWLLGTSPEDRHAKYKYFKDIYDIRSAVAHSGEVSSKVLRSKANENIEIYKQLATEVCRYMLVHGQPSQPEWEEKLCGISDHRKLASGA